MNGYILCKSILTFKSQNLFLNPKICFNVLVWTWRLMNSWNIQFCGRNREIFDCTVNAMINQFESSIYITMLIFILALLSSGEPCPENGRSPGSTQHSSPRSDFNSRMFCNNSAPFQNSAPSTTGSSPPDTVANQNLQPSDVTIQRKESEGFGFVIISSLNRPETAAAAGKE